MRIFRLNCRPEGRPHIIEKQNFLRRFISIKLQ